MPRRIQRINILKSAIFEANRFVSRANELVESIEADEGYGNGSPKISGATKRASMDLTRALAEFRRDI